LPIPKYPVSLEEAKQAPDGYVIIEGELGGICYLVCPPDLVACDERALRLLAHDLEDAVFSGDTEGASVRYERLALEEVLSGFALGEESGIALRTLWLPKWLSEAQLGRRIQQILAGEFRSLDLSQSEQAMVKVLHNEYHTRKFAELTK